jgi:hypothetical protein
MYYMDYIVQNLMREMVAFMNCPLIRAQGLCPKTKRVVTGLYVGACDAWVRKRDGGHMPALTRR